MKKELFTGWPLPFNVTDFVLENYADTLVNFSPGKGEGLKSGQTMLVVGQTYTEPLMMRIRDKIIRAGGNFIPFINLSDTDRYWKNKMILNNGTETQLSFFPKDYFQGIVNSVDHVLFLISDLDTRAFEGIAQRKIQLLDIVKDDFRMKMIQKKEDAGDLTWCLALYPTPGMAQEVGQTYDEYWEQVIKATFSDSLHPVAKWIKISGEIKQIAEKLTDMNMESIRITTESGSIDLTVQIGNDRKWVGGRGVNIPSFEIYTSPRRLGTNGHISFNEPLYHNGSLMDGISLRYENGQIVEAHAKTNEKALFGIIDTDQAARFLGEVSLTDGGMSPIEKLMGNILYDENRGGPQGNTHIAVGNAYRSTYKGDGGVVSEDIWINQRGFNKSATHVDIISTEQRTVVATVDGGTLLTIYKNGKFLV